jgi:hypothetical protein
MYIKVDNLEYPYSFDRLRADNPNTSFPAKMPDERLAEWGVSPVVPTTQPEAQYTYNVRENTPKLEGTVWKQVWVVEPASEVEIAGRTIDRWAEVRAERNMYLAECDWTQLPDAPLDTNAWRVYRQALRDITAQTDPYNIAWPEPPQMT